jgi:hypothetical protein
MFRSRRDRSRQGEDVEEELVIEQGEDYPLPQGKHRDEQVVYNVPTSVEGLRDYVQSLSRNLEEAMNIRNELDKILRLRPVIDNYISILGEVVKILGEIRASLNRLEELKQKLATQ